MQISIAKPALQQGLSRLQAIVEKRNSMPILAHALLTAKADGKLEITGTDLEVGVRGVYPCEVKRPGALTVSARKLYEITRELGDADVHLQATPNSFLEIVCGRSRFVLAGTTAEEFPELPELAPGSVARLQAAVLSSMIAHSVYAVSLDETRYNLNGVFLEVVPDSQKLRMVATDGHRLAQVDRAVGDEAAALTSGVILPRKALLELRKLVDEEDADEVELGFEGSNAVVRKGDVTLSMRLIEGEFPNYRQVIPKDSRQRILVHAEALARALRRVALLSLERSRAVSFELGAGRLVVSASTPDLGEAQEELDLDYDGESLKLGFNARYLLDALDAFQAKEVEMHLGDELAPALLRPADDPDTVAVVMPMRL